MNKKKIYMGYPNIGNKAEFLKYAEDILDKRRLSNNGEYVKKFEKELSDYLGVKNVIAVCNGTIGLEVAAKALELKGEVILPSFTFIATAHMLRWQGIKPVFCDINSDTYTIDYSKIESLITSKTTGIVGVHLWGMPCEIDKLEHIAQKHDLKLMFDAAHAFGCSYNDIKIANFGKCEVFSFHATKIFNTFEGGAITTNDDELAEKIRLMINFGFSGQDKVIYLGINGKMTEIHAAMGITNLKHIGFFIKDSRYRYNIYEENLKNIAGVNLVKYKNSQCTNNYHYIAIVIDEKTYGVSRDNLKKKLEEYGVIARRYFYPGCHNMEPYKSEQQGLNLPETEILCNEILLLPNGDNCMEKDIVKICSIIRK